MKKIVLIMVLLSIPQLASAQEVLPEDNGLSTYHTAPRYRSSESHPLRVAAYLVHPIGWVFREVLFRPFSYMASSTETTRSVFGYREPYDYRQPECFAADDSVPDCRTINPFNYDAVIDSDVGSLGDAEVAATTQVVRQVYFPDVNFDFDVRKLNTLGEGKVRQIANLLKEEDGLHVVLEGHADFKGSEEYNEKLGMDRAEAVRTALVSSGIPEDRLSTVTFGKSQPALGEQDDPARAVNRRVEIHIDNAAQDNAAQDNAAQDAEESGETAEG